MRGIENFIMGLVDSLRLKPSERRIGDKLSFLEFRCMKFSDVEPFWTREHILYGFDYTVIIRLVSDHDRCDRCIEVEGLLLKLEDAGFWYAGGY